MAEMQGPLTGSPPEEVALLDPPLIRVLAQVRFPLIASIESQDFIGAFQEAIRRDYPVLRPERSQSVVLGPAGVQEARTSVLWRFNDPRSGWRVTLAPDFVALETSRYSSRDDFMERFESALGALVASVEPAEVDRLGVRYLDRLVGEDLRDLHNLVRREVGGILATELRDRTHQAFTECLFEIPDEAGMLRARWGMLPSGATIDPSAVEPIDERSWLLDIDAYRASEGDGPSFDIEAIVADARAFAARIYSVFRWVVTDEFLRRFGGQP